MYWLIAVPLLLSPIAPAHIGAPEGRLPFLDEGGELRGGATSWGLVLRAAPGCDLRVCEEAFYGTPRFWHLTDSGRLVVGSVSGLSASDDDGCSFTYLPDYEDVPVEVGASAPDTDVAWSATTRATGEDTVVVIEGNADPVAVTTIQDVGLSSMVSSRDGQRVTAGGITTAGAPAPVVMIVDRDEGVIVERTTWPTGTQRVNVIGRAADGATAVSVVGEAGNSSTLWILTGDLEDDTLVASMEGLITDYAAFNGAHHFIVDKMLFYRMPVGGSFETLEEIPGGPARCLLVGRDGRLWGCGVPFHGGHFLISDDGETFDPLLQGSQVTERVCPEGTRGYEICNDALGLVPDPELGSCQDELGQDAGPAEPDPSPDPSVESDGGERDGGVDPSSPTCACSSTADEAVWFGAALLVAGAGWLRPGRRRARRGRAPGAPCVTTRPAISYAYPTAPRRGSPDRFAGR